LQPPRNLLLLFLITTLGFLVGLGWLGWRTLEQDKDLEAQSVRERLENTAEIVADGLRRNVGDLEVQLERFSALPTAALGETVSIYARQLPADALIVAFEAGSVQAFPRQRLLYYPTLPAAEEFISFGSGPAPQGVAAVEHFRALAQSDDRRVRADATLSLGRTLRELGRHQAALETLRSLNDPDVLLDGRPVEPLARRAICEMLSEAGATAELAEAVSAFERDLHAGRWQLTRAAYVSYQEAVREFRGRVPAAGAVSRPSPTSLSLAEAVAYLWRVFQEQGLTPETAPPRQSRVWQGQPVFLLWRASSDRILALVAGRGFLQDRVVDPLGGVLDRSGVCVQFESDGLTVLSQCNPGANAQRAVRTTNETRLPWTVTVVTANPDVDRAAFSTRRQLILGGLVFLALFVTAGSYLSVRAMTREIEAVRLKSDFVAAVSHEFRTPLTLLRQFSDLLADDRVSSEQERRRYYAALQRGTRRLTRLVEDLLDFGRMEAGSRAFRLERVDAQRWFSAVTSEFEEEIRGKGYHLEAEYTCPQALVIKADEEAIGRALWNLLDNAVKYSPTCKTIWASAGLENGRLTIRVRDQGVGVEPGEQRQIFRKFVRGSATNTQVVKGTGLGLALVEQIVQAHHGTITLESVVGEGSTFTISLPAEVEHEEQNAWRAS